jgi:hypothetical protein
MTTHCHCTELPILWSSRADQYADRHLVREVTDENGVSRFRCAVCRRGWLQDHPADDHGRLTLRLRWAELTATDVVTYLGSEPGLDAYLLTMHPKVEHQPLPDGPVLHGVSELRSFTERWLSEENPPRGAVMEVIGGDDEALILGRVSHARDGRYVEHRPAAWILAVNDARVTRVRAFSDWTQARGLFLPA